MKIVFSALARRELEDAARYYEFQYAGLGKRFKKEVRKSVHRIAQYPEAWSIEREIRKCSLHKFPYKLLYSIEQDHIFIVGIGL